jgi:hypothetical protein
MMQQDSVIDLLNQDLKMESIPPPPDLPAVQPQGPPVSEIYCPMRQQDFAIDLLTQDFQMESVPLPPDMLAVQPPLSSDLRLNGVVINSCRITSIFSNNSTSQNYALQMHLHSGYMKQKFPHKLTPDIQAKQLQSVTRWRWPVHTFSHPEPASKG